MADGLRQRKKQATRQALSWAAVRLAVVRGFHNVLVNNYFSSKAEAVTSRHLERVQAMAVSLRLRPSNEPLWDAIINAAVAHSGGRELLPEPEWTAGVRLMLSEPALLGEMLKAGALAQRELAEVIAERTATDAERDLYPRLVAAAIGAAIQVANDQWLQADPPVALAGLVHQTLTQIAAGLPVPSATPRFWHPGRTSPRCATCSMSCCVSETPSSTSPDLMAGADIHYDVPDGGHPMTGRWMPDLSLNNDSGVTTRVAELMRRARPILLDLAARSDLTESAAPWSDRVDIVSATSTEHPADAVLIRPDAYVAWPRYRRRRGRSPARAAHLVRRADVVDRRADVLGRDGRDAFRRRRRCRRAAGRALWRLRLHGD